MLHYFLELASSHSEELYRLGCYPSDVVVRFSDTTGVIFAALCIA